MMDAIAAGILLGVQIWAATVTFLFLTIGLLGFVGLVRLPEKIRKKQAEARRRRSVRAGMH